MAASKKNRIFGLDLLRSFAILSVMWGHSTLILSELIPSKWIYFFSFDGVTVFFVLSGYLIGGIWFRQISNNELSGSLMLQFWVRRWFRTLPNYYLILLLLAFLSYTFRELSVQEFLPYLLFLQNFNWVHPTFFPEAWSLSVEEWFYLLLPLFFFAFYKMFKPKMDWALWFFAAIVIVLGIVLRFYKGNIIDDSSFILWDDHVRRQVLNRLDSIIYGVIAAYIHLRFPNFWKEKKGALFVLGVVLLLSDQFIQFYNFFHRMHFGLYLDVFSFIIASLATALMLPFLSTWMGASNYLEKPIRWISLTSYSLYLINSMLIMGFVLPAVASSGLMEGWGYTNVKITELLLFWGLSFTLASVLYRYFEKPVMELRERFG